MGTTRIKVIDLSSSEKEIKTSRKHAEKLTGPKKAAEEPKSAKTHNQETVVKQEPTEESQAQENLESSAQAEEQKVAKTETAHKTTKSQKSSKNLHVFSRKYRSAKEQIENKVYPLKEALEILPKTSFVKFDPAVEVHINVSDKSIRGNVTLPHLKPQKAKSKKYLVFFDKKSDIGDEKIIWADEKTIGKIEDQTLKPGKDFDVVLTSAKFMPQLAKVAKILGPKGLMPNPKNGTILEEPKSYFSTSKDTGQISFKTDPQAPIIHLKIGKLSQKSEEIEENLKALITAIGTSKIKKVTLTTTMGPGIRVDAAKP